MEAEAFPQPGMALVNSQTGSRETSRPHPRPPCRGGREERRAAAPPAENQAAGRPRPDSGPSAGGVAAQEGVEHGQLHPLLVPTTPRHDRALAVGRVEVVAVARVRQADTQATERGQHSQADTHTKKKTKNSGGGAPDDGFTGLGKGDLSDWLQIPRAPQPDHAVLQPAGDHVDGHSLRLVGEGHGADDLSAVDVADQVAVHSPQTQVAASAH